MSVLHTNRYSMIELCRLEGYHLDFEVIWPNCWITPMPNSKNESPVLFVSHILLWHRNTWQLHVGCGQPLFQPVLLCWSIKSQKRAKFCYRTGWKDGEKRNSTEKAQKKCNRCWQASTNSERKSKVAPETNPLRLSDQPLEHRTRLITDFSWLLCRDAVLWPSYLRHFVAWLSLALFIPAK